jgi:hypothetical protein
MQAQFDGNRGFGVEIETAPSRRHSIHTIAQALTNAGILCTAEHGHTTRRHWKAVPDSSTGSEIVSPILYGQDGLDEVKRVCKILRDIGLKVDSSTGLHVHHDARDLTARQYASAMYLYAKAEDFMAQLLPSRVSAQWCRPLSLEALSSNYRQLVRGNDSRKYMMSGCRCAEFRGRREHYCGHRYYATNPTNANETGTLEFRQHGGSLNGTKIGAAIARNVSATAIVSQDPTAETLMYALGRDTNCEVTKAARQNIVQRVFISNPYFYLGTAARYLTTAQRRAHRAYHPGTRAQHRAAAQPVTTAFSTDDPIAREQALWAARGVILDHQMIEQQS